MGDSHISKIISIANRKGGVGKTTLTIALAEAYISEHKAHVAIVDLDPQSSASELLLSAEEYKDRFDAGELLPNLWDVDTLFARKNVDPALVKGLTRILGRHEVELALLANSTALWDLEYKVLRKNQIAKYSTRVKSTLAALRKDFDVIIVDCPPGRLLAADDVLAASDIVLCPIVPQKLSLLGMMQMQKYFQSLKDTNKTIPPWKFVWSKYEERTKEAQRCINEVNNSDFKDHFLTKEHVSDDVLSTYRPIQLKQKVEIVNRLSAYSNDDTKITSFDRLYKELQIELRDIVRAIDIELGT